jgi:hypothetical protein
LGEAIDSDLLEAQHCPSGNQDLARWLTARSQQKDHLLPRTANTFEGFLVELKDTVDINVLKDRPINYIMSDAAPFRPTCSGDWMEFGVFTGDTINMAARTRRSVCGDFCSPVFGFDTFTGLPEAWVRDDSDPDLGVDGQGTFNLEGKFPPVEPNVQLIKGIFLTCCPYSSFSTSSTWGRGRSPSFTSTATCTMALLTCSVC